MAFNPFHRFRKHQKAMMAFLAILCMVIFGFQFGAGDVFTRALAFFGSFGGKGQLVTRLYGDKVYELDLDQARRHRQLANQFLLNLPSGGQFPGGLGTYLVASVSQMQGQMMRSGEGAPQPLPAAAADLPQRVLSRYYGRASFQGAQNDLRDLRAAFQLPDIGKNPEQLKNLETLAAALAYQAWVEEQQTRGRTAREELLFGGTLSTEDLLDFLIWQHEADRLGIVLTDADVGREINRITGNRELFADEGFDRNPLVREAVRSDDRRRQAGPGLTANDLLEALRAEFRVQMAKEALLGHGSGIRMFQAEAEPVRVSPAVPTPDEFLDYFRDQRTTVRVGVLPVSVGNFVDKVKGRPSEEELLHRYEEYKDKDPIPYDRRPGFRQPRRIRVQYARVDSSSAFYQAKAKEMARALAVYSDPATSAALRVMAAAKPLPAGGLGGWAALAALPHTFDPLGDEYQNLRQDEERNVSQGLSTAVDLRDRRPLVRRPEGHVGALGVLLGASQTGLATPVAAASLMPGLQAQHERATLRAFGSAVLAGASRSPWTAITLPAPFTHAPLSRPEARDLLVQRFEKSLARTLAEENIRAFEEALRKERAKPTEVQKYIEGAAKQYGLEDLTLSPRLDSKYELGEDPALKPIREAYSKYAEEYSRILAQFAQQGMRPPGTFEEWLFEGAGVYEPRVVPEFGQQGRGTWLVWRTEDKPIRARPFDEVRDEVEASWRFDRARLLAREEAERIKKALDEQHRSPEDALKFLRDQKQGTEFELANVARLIPRSNIALPGREDRADFRPYEVPADKIAYPPPDFLDRLLALKEDGTATVIADRPAKHYYVAVLLARSVPPLREFNDLYAKPALNDPIWVQMMTDRRVALQKELMRQLRVDAAGKDGVDAEGNLKLPENLRARTSETEPE
jgi:hypothetical protein